MTDNNLKTLLEELSHHPSSGSVSNECRTRTRESILALEAPHSATSRGVVFDFIVTLPRELTDIVARPVAFAALVFVMVLGTWISGVNASLDTVPGDAFYSVKIVSEKAQLSLAGSGAKGRLHAEFASRRLNEVAVLVDSDDDDKGEQIQVALDGFQKQIEGVENRIENANNDAEVVELARIVDQKAGELEEVLAISESANDEESSEALSASREVTDVAKDKAVESLSVNAESVVSLAELERQFKGDIVDIKAAQGTLLDRINRISRVVFERDVELSEFDETELLYLVESVDLSGAENFAAQGGYIRAFELTASLEQRLRDVSARLAVAEIALTHPAEEVVEEEIESVDEVVEEVVEEEVIEGKTEEPSTEE